MTATGRNDAGDSEYILLDGDDILREGDEIYTAMTGDIMFIGAFILGWSRFPNPNPAWEVLSSSYGFNLLGRKAGDVLDEIWELPSMRMGLATFIGFRSDRSRRAEGIKFRRRVNKSSKDKGEEWSNKLLKSLDKIVEKEKTPV